MKPILFILTVFLTLSCSVKNPANFDLKNIQQKNPEISAIQNEFVKITPTPENQSPAGKEKPFDEVIEKIPSIHY